MFEWDENKRQNNLEKHGVDFSEIVQMDMDTALVIEDDRQDYGEPRRLVYGLIKGRLHAAVVTPRRFKIRVISLRKANARERAVYEK